MKLYIVLFRYTETDKWQVDGVHEDQATAEAHLHYETLKFPRLIHALATGELEDAVAAEGQ